MRCSPSSSSCSSSASPFSTAPRRTRWPPSPMTCVPPPDELLLHGLRTLVVRGNAAVQMAAARCRPSACYRGSRLSALALVASMVPTTLAGLAYWSREDPAARKQQRIQFHENLAMIGGLLFAVLDRPW